MNHAIKPGPETCSPAGWPELSVGVPTFNERANVTVYQQLKATQVGISWEVAFVDDNPPDGTGELVRGLVQKDRLLRLAQAMTAE